MKTGIQILLTGAFLVFSFVSFGQVQEVSEAQIQKKTLVVKGDKNHNLHGDVKRKKSSHMVNRKEIVDKRQFVVVPATEK